MLPGCSLIKLELNTDLLPFKCTDTDLNEFFLEDAKNHLKERIAVTYIIQNNDETVAYWNYLNDKISARDIDNNWDIWKNRI